MLTLRDLTFGYDKKNVFENLNLDIPSGTVLIRGSNGSGKSTLLNLIMGIIKPQKGIITAQDNSLSYKKLSQRAKENGYLYQNSEVMLFANSVYDELAFPLKLNGVREEEIRRRVYAIMDRFKLTPYKNCFPLKLSQGLKQRLALSCLCVLEPKRLLLDEPTSRLDSASKEILVKLLINMQKEGKDLIIATHDDELQEKIQGQVIDMDRL